jgi:hypothetical protein
VLRVCDDNLSEFRLRKFPNPHPGNLIDLELLLKQASRGPLDYEDVDEYEVLTAGIVNA